MVHTHTLGYEPSVGASSRKSENVFAEPSTEPRAFSQRNIVTSALKVKYVGFYVFSL